jgi:hypothetical protein
MSLTGAAREYEERKSDPRIADLDRALSRSERHSAICSCLNLHHSMYELVWVLDRKEKGNPSVQCRACLSAFVGGPDRIMAHNVAELRGIATCAPVDSSSKEEALRACEKATARHAEKLAAAAVKKRKAELQSIANAAREKMRRRQTTLSETTVGAVSWTPREVANDAWARCAYEERLHFALFDSAAFKEAVAATPRAVSA